MKKTQKRSAIRENIRLAAEVRLCPKKRILDELVFHALLLRTVQRSANYRPERIARFEADFLEVLELHYRWVERFRWGDAVEAPEPSTDPISRLA